MKKIMKEILSYGHIEGRKMHPHRNMGMEIVLVDRGNLEWAVEEAPEHLQSGDVFFTLPWQTHGSTAIGEPQNKIYFVLFKLKSDYREKQSGIRFPDSLGFLPQEQRKLSDIFCIATRHTWNASPVLKQLFPELIMALDSKNRLDNMSAVSLLRLIIVELARIIEKGESYRTRSNLSTNRVRSFLDSLAQDVARDWSLDQMAAACGVKRTQFAKISQQLCGHTPLTYLAMLRFSKACSLLLNTKRSITQIAFECGYNSSQYFSDAFRKRFKMTPSMYRRDAPHIKKQFDSKWQTAEWRSIKEEQTRIAEAGGHLGL